MNDSLPPANQNDAERNQQHEKRAALEHQQAALAERVQLEQHDERARHHHREHRSDQKRSEWGRPENQEQGADETGGQDQRDDDEHVARKVDLEPAEIPPEAGDEKPVRALEVSAAVAPEV